MPNNSKIEWTDMTVNPVVGCTPISAGCDNCYARTLHNRRHEAYKRGAKLPDQYAQPFEVLQFFPDRMQELLHMRKPRRVFVGSTTDLFHANIPFEVIMRVCDVMSRAPQHTYILLTKRVDRMLDTLRIVYGYGFAPPPRLIVGATIETQKQADERVPILLQLKKWVPSVKLMVSVEPMLGAVTIRRYLYSECQTCHGAGTVWAGDGGAMCPQCGWITNGLPGEIPHLDWIICGGETGPSARPMHARWVKLLRDQCQAAGVPFFFKSWGNFVAESQAPEDSVLPSRSFAPDGWDMRHRDSFVFHVGKRTAGRLLDGVEWNQFPAVQP